MTSGAGAGGDAESDLSVAAFRGTWDYGRLSPRVRIGERCFIESPRLIRVSESGRIPRLVLGDDVHLYLAGWGGSLFVDEDGLLEIGDRTVLAGAQVMCREHISIGADVRVSYNVVIADCDFHPTDPVLRRSDALATSPYGARGPLAPLISRPVVVADGVSLGINAVVLKGVRIGEGAQVLAGSVVTKDVPAGATVAGNPCQVVHS